MIAVAGTAVYQLSVEFVVADSGTRTTTTAKKEVGTGNVEAIHDIAFCPMAGGANFLAAVVNSGCLIWDLSKDDSEDPVLVRVASSLPTQAHVILADTPSISPSSDCIQPSERKARHS